MYCYFGTQFGFFGTMGIYVWDALVEGAKRSNSLFCRWSQNAELWVMGILITAFDL